MTLMNFSLIESWHLVPGLQSLSLDVSPRPQAWGRRGQSHTSRFKAEESSTVQQRGRSGLTDSDEHFTRETQRQPLTGSKALLNKSLQVLVKVRGSQGKAGNRTGVEVSSVCPTVIWQSGKTANLSPPPLATPHFLQCAIGGSSPLGTAGHVDGHSCVCVHVWGACS